MDGCKPARLARVLRVPNRIWATRSVVVACCLLPAGCIFCDAAGYLVVRGTLLDEQSGEPVSGAAIGGRTFTGAQETGYGAPIIFDGSPQGPLSSDNGTFEEVFSTGLMPCGRTAPEFPRPDRVEIIVVRDGCEQSFFVDINEDTVVDMTFPDDVIELKDPILVPPCAQ